MNLDWCFIVVLVYILVETDAVYEYAKLLRIPLPLIKDYEEAKKSGGSNNYFDHLSVFKNSFLMRMITCPTCITVTLSFLLTIVQTKFPTSLLGFLGAFGVNTFGSWLGYRLLKTLDRQINE